MEHKTQRSVSKFTNSQARHNKIWGEMQGMPMQNLLTRELHSKLLRCCPTGIVPVRVGSDGGRVGEVRGEARRKEGETDADGGDQRLGHRRTGGREGAP